MNLTELLLTQNNGSAVDALSEQFGLNRAQTISAIEALMPAFSTGLKRNTSGASGAASLIEALANGHHGRYIDEPKLATSGRGVSEGNAILGHLFGNKDVSRAVAAQAAQSTGIGSSLLKKMLPVIASMVMGALFKGSTGSRGGGLGGALGQAAGGGLLGTIIEGLAGGMMGGARQPRRRRRTSRTRRGSNPLEDLLGQVLGGGNQPRRRKSTRRTGGADKIMPPSRTGRATKPRSSRRNDGGLGDIFDQFSGGSSRQRQRPVPQPRRRGNGLEQIFGDMFEPGGSSNSQYQRETGSVFDEFLGPSGR